MSSGHVLVVEDEKDLAEGYATILEDEFEVTTAYSGEEALGCIEDSTDVVLLDRRMPDRSGEEILEAIRERIDCRVAMVTAVEPDFDIIEMGFDDYLIKPVSGEELRQTVTRLLERTSYDDQVRRHLALVSKLDALESGKEQTELEASEEYTRLRREIATSRNRLETALSDDVLVELLRRETGNRLYLVIEYDADTYDYRYVNDDVEEGIATIHDDFDEMLKQCRQENRQKSELDAAFQLQGYYCSVHLFDTLLFLHFPDGSGGGIVCGFDPDTAPNLTNFVSLVHPYIEQPGADDALDEFHDLGR